MLPTTFYKNPKNPLVYWGVLNTHSAYLYMGRREFGIWRGPNLRWTKRKNLVSAAHERWDMMGFRYVRYVVVPISFVRVPVCWNSFRIFMGCSTNEVQRSFCSGEQMQVLPYWWLTSRPYHPQKTFNSLPSPKTGGTGRRSRLPFWGLGTYIFNT